MNEKPASFLNLPTPSQDSLARTSSPSSTIEKRLLRLLLRAMGEPALRFILWDGTAIAPPGKTPVAGVRLLDRQTYWWLLANPALHFGDGYATGRIEVEGELLTLLKAIYAARPPKHKMNLLARYTINRPRRSQRRNTPTGSQGNIHHHYDLGNDFYRLWLDQEMAYTCAYFPTPEVSLETAQVAKMDLVCRKLRLKPGERVIEAGCGWGGLARHMARHYGVKVKAYNLSHEQINEARTCAKREGLDDRIEYIEDDYRNIGGQCDVFVSVGMLEHVGVDNYRALGGVIDRCLTESGRGLLHSIGQSEVHQTNAWTEKRIFPGGYIPTLRQMMEVFEPWGFSILDVENLRLHYAQTLAHWLARFEQHRDEIQARYGDPFVRAWRLYLTASQANFSSGLLQLFQVVFSRPKLNDIPWTRDYLYRDASL